MTNSFTATHPDRKPRRKKQSSPADSEALA